MRFALLLLLCLLAAGTPAVVPTAYAQDAAEIAFWESVRDSQNPAELQAYLDAYPNGTYAPLAKIRLGTLGAAVPPSAPAAQPQSQSQPQPQSQPAPATTAAPAKSGPQISTDRAVYGPFEPITVTWKELPGSLRNGWIKVVGQDGTEVTVSSQTFTGPSGSVELDGTLPGTYEVLLLTPPYGSEYTLARTSFTIAEPGTAEAGQGPILTLTSNALMPFEPIELRWESIPPSMRTGWIRMSTADGTEVQFQSITFSERSGKTSFDGTLPGDYVFELLSPPYGNELVMAMTTLTILDPNAAAPSPAPAPAAAAGTAAPAPAGVTRSTLGAISFADQPQIAEPQLGPMLMTALEPDMTERCAGPTENFRWTIAAGEEARVQELLNRTVLSLRENGYALDQVSLTTENALVYKAVGPDRLLVAWVYDEESQFLGLVLCPAQ